MFDMNDPAFVVLFDGPLDPSSAYLMGGIFAVCFVAGLLGLLLEHWKK